MSVTLSRRPVDAVALVALAAYSGPVTRCPPGKPSRALSASDLVRSGVGPCAGAWLSERSSARRTRRALRRAAAEARAAAMADAYGA